MNLTKNDNVVVITKFIVQKLKINKFIVASSEMQKMVVKEPNCLMFQIYQDEQNTQVFIFSERYQDMNAFEYHCSTEHFNNYVSKMIPDLIESIEVSTYKEIFLAK
ncbi:MAG: antibiotic biosynthesis monooxygenase [Bacteroidia bacterium]|nr:MAG: antibiotic biosynthesis monooxygenase [Bacteroidia bacterium]